MKTILRAGAALGLILTPIAAPAQPAPGRGTERQDALDPSPVDPAKDPAVGLFLGDWRSAKPRTLFGGLVVHDILTPLGDADPLKPRARGAVLIDITSVSRAALAPGATASGRMPAGTRAMLYTAEGAGQIIVGGRAHDLREGVFIVLTPDFDFRLTNSGKAPLAFYMRTEPVPAGAAPATDVAITSRWDNDRRIGAHWLHICNGGVGGSLLCTVAPHTMPQPHSHNWEELWLAVKGESVLMLGKQLVRMHPGQAYKIPPSGLAAHSNLNPGDTPIQLLYMGPLVRKPHPPLPDFAQLENAPIDPAGAPDIDLFMGSWQDAYPRIAHGNLYMRDMLTALTGTDPVKPIRKGAVLTAATAVSYAMLEPGATAHPAEGDAKDVQETFVVNSGTGTLTVDGKTLALAKGQAFILSPGRDFRLTATGSDYLTFHVVAEKAGAAAPASVTLIDHQGERTVASDWNNQRRPVVTAADGLQRLGSISAVTLKPMAIARPYSVAAGGEEIWIALDDADALIGKQLRHLKAGTAWKAPPTGITAGANINLGSTPARFLHIIAK
ncbi:MAG: cupin domain-containing protein [Sphingomonadales bacterium]|jgi:mannose-6-phosphate isomerase-like protein (cupin superfamily)